MLYVVCVYIVVTIAVMILAPTDEHPINKNKPVHKIDKEIDKEEK